jgi:hypothetical protein
VVSVSWRRHADICSVRRANVLYFNNLFQLQADQMAAYRLDRVLCRNAWFCIYPRSPDRSEHFAIRSAFSATGMERVDRTCIDYKRSPHVLRWASFFIADNCLLGQKILSPFFSQLFIKQKRQTKKDQKDIYKKYPKKNKRVTDRKTWFFFLDRPFISNLPA